MNDRHILLGSVLTTLLAATVAFGQLADPITAEIQKSSITIELETVASGLVAPNVLTHARDGSDRLFVADQTGQIRVIDNGMLLPGAYLDLSAQLVTLPARNDPSMPNQGLNTGFDERGLLGLAFHPDFATPGSAGANKFYTYHSEGASGTADFPLPIGVTPEHQSVITEWTVDDDITSNVFSGSPREIMRIDEPQFNHNAGAVQFGPDKLLYIAIGDGGRADDQTEGHSEEGNGQDITNILGSVARIDPLGQIGNTSANGQYTIPTQNPFVGETGVHEIYAYGFRNPFRFSFDVDPATGLATPEADGTLYLGDVGQNDIEEINIVTIGGNYGWRIKEGSFFFNANGEDSGFVTNTGPVGVSPELLASLIDPIAEYDHNQASTGSREGISAIGGFVYRGTTLPQLVGKYVFGDFSQEFIPALGRLFVIDLIADDLEVEELRVGLDDLPLGLYVKGIGQDADGELYVLASSILGPTGTSGSVIKIVPEPTTGMIFVLTIAMVAASRRREVRSDMIQKG